MRTSTEQSATGGLEHSLLLRLDGGIVLERDRGRKRAAVKWARNRPRSSAAAATARLVGQVDGFVVDGDDQITHLVLERGHLWGRREVTIPIGAVARVETDANALNLTRDEVGALPEARGQRLPLPGWRVR